MDDDLLCPTCRTDEHLRGERRGDEVIHITCDACGLEWDRDLEPRCPSCGRRDLRSAAQAVWEKSRGSQLSIVSMTAVHLCPDCDAEKVERVRDSNTPLPPPDNPAAGMR
jgi:ribosomal protein L37AE/L43A